MIKSKLGVFAVSFVFCAALLLSWLPSAQAATSITITSPSAGSTITSGSFTVTGTATANRTITVRIDGATVGTTTSDASGDWSLAVTGQSEGAKTISATASTDLLYSNVIDVGSFSDSRMSVVNTLNGQEESLFNIFTGGTVPLEWQPSPDFSKAYGTNPYLNSPLIWSMDLSTGAISTFTMAGTSPTPSSIAFNNDGSKVYIADNANDIVRVYNTTTNTEVGSPITVGDSPLSMMRMPNSPYIGVVDSLDAAVSIINTATDSVIFSFPVGTSPNASAFNAEGTRMYVGVGSNGDVQIYDTSNANLLGTLDGTDGSQIENMVLNAAGTRLYAPHPGGNFVDVFDLEAGSLMTSINVGTGPWSVAMSSDDTKVYATVPNLLGGLNGTTVAVIETATNTLADPITPGSGAPFIGFIKAEAASTEVSITIASNTLANTGVNIYLLWISGAILLAGGSIVLIRRYAL